MADIYLSVDVGGSQTKIIYQLAGSKKPNYLLMPPAVEEITKTKLDNYMARLGWIGSPSPDQQLWVVWDERVVVLGDFAACFDPQDRIKELKYENALWKVLGAIGLIVETSNIKVSPKKPLKVELALLLPWNEYSDRRRFEEQLRKMLAGFGVRNTALKVSLERFLCRPEGGGLAAVRIKQQGIDWLRSQQLGVLMFGHRNTTALYFDRGQLKLGDSPLLGFANMLDMVIEMTSGLDRERLALAIFQARYAVLDEIYNPNYSNTRRPDWSTCAAIIALASAKDPNLRDKEIQDIGKAISVATAEYWDKLERWMSRVLPAQLDEVIIGGGAAYHVEPELEKYFNCEPKIETQPSLSRNSYGSGGTKIRTSGYKSKDYNKHFTPMIWGSGISEQVKQTFNLEKKQFGEQCTSSRLVDCFGLFDYLVGLEATNDKS
ncbi:hypothetical protein PCC6912_61870 [Chlorogloeopsis fritschii PCC 6912]|uniref:Actin-like protein N-terminal domain-containing protein n=3 Tax=Chlorogloeopsis fritschii TaxID=1124 RepID=A0A3S0ZL34_CHLFR|nr:ParM/StbA family protein [Chlorogloeopsis fritschii]RUR72630.1 hypothetical protein PCC6912_61870 [Chlorogloeopsis fritschii PCC 6912]